MVRVLIAKEALLREINHEMASLHACRNLRVLEVVHDPARTQGGNWKTVGLERSGYDHAECECQKAMVQYIADMQEGFDI